MFRTFRWSEHFEEGTLRFAVTASYQNGSFCVAGWKRSHRDDNSFAPIPDIGIFQNPHRVFEGGRALIRRARTHAHNSYTRGARPIPHPSHADGFPRTRSRKAVSATSWHSGEHCLAVVHRLVCMCAYRDRSRAMAACLAA